MEKINKLMKEWPKGSIKLTSSLEKKGYHKDLLKKYVRNDWLESLGYGSYKLAGDDVGWQGAINVLQEAKKSKLHPGGKTALILKGFAHYLGKSLYRIEIFGSTDDVVPKWIHDNDWKVVLRYVQTKIFNYKVQEAFIKVSVQNVDVKISAPELAAMEMLYLVPKEQSFDEAMKIMEGLTTLRVNLVQKLLEECSSIKVKRLFLFMSESLRLPWFPELDLKNLNLGTGKRSIVKEGVLDKKYHITVPQEYAR